MIVKFSRPFINHFTAGLVLITAASLAIGCSDVSFDQKAGDGGSTAQNANGADGAVNQPGAGGDDASGNVNQPGTPPGGTGGTGPVNNPPGGTTPPGGTVPPGTPTAPASVIPRVIFIGPPCVRGTNCLVIFELDQPYSQNVDYDWVTNDTAFTTYPPPAPDTLVARPNYHYVPTGGHITFPAGTVRKEVFIQNINPDNTKIIIYVKMRNCMYGGAALNCTAIFR